MLLGKFADCCSTFITAVTVASSGLEALDILRKHEKGTFHLILTVFCPAQLCRLSLSFVWLLSSTHTPFVCSTAVSIVVRM